VNHAHVPDEGEGPSFELLAFETELHEERPDELDAPEILFGYEPHDGFESFCGVTTDALDLDDDLVRRPTVVVVDQLANKIVTVLEVPVEASPRHTKVIDELVDPQLGVTFGGNNVEGAPQPFIAGQPGLLFSTDHTSMS
jgi:hypothetical protein